MRHIKSIPELLYRLGDELAKTDNWLTAVRVQAEHRSDIGQNTSASTFVDTLHAAEYFLNYLRDLVEEVSDTWERASDTWARADELAGAARAGGVAERDR